MTAKLTIEPGALVKRCGYVQYADGLKYKISRKTWLVSKVEGDQVFFKDENGNDTLLPLPKNEGAFLVVGDENGLFEEYKEPTAEISVGGVSQKYRVHGDDEKNGWRDGDIVRIHGNVSKATIDSGKLENVPDSVPHQHVLVVVDPIRVFGKANPQ